MRVAKLLQPDQESILRFINVLGNASVMLSNSKRARPSFFIFAHSFITEYVEESFFKKVDLIIQALEDSGFPTEEGPVAALHADQHKSREAAAALIAAAKIWQAGDDQARGEVLWAASDLTAALRQHLERLSQRTYPLLEQTLEPDDEHRIAEGFNKVLLEFILTHDPEKPLKQIATLEEELSDWK